MRAAIVSPYQYGYVDGYNAAANVAPFTSRLGPINLQSLVFETVIQSGLDRLDFVNPPVAPKLTPLLRSFVNIDAPVVAGAVEISDRSVAIASELLNSRAFDSYKGAHADLESLETDYELGVSKLAKAAEILAKRNRRILRVSALPLNVLPFSAKVIDALTGGLLGRISESIADLLRGSLTQRRRLIVYDHSPLLPIAMKSRAREILQ